MKVRRKVRMEVREGEKTWSRREQKPGAGRKRTDERQ